MSSPPAGFFEMTAVYQMTTLPRVATWSLGFEDTLIVDPDPVDAANELYSMLIASGRPCTASNMCDTWRFMRVHVTKMLESGPVVGEYGTPVTGTASTQPLTVNTAVLINKTTGLGGRRNRGRMFVPPVKPQEAGVDGTGLISSIELSTLQGLWDSFYGQMITTGYTPQLFHQTAPFTPTPVTGFVVQPMVATQRRRMRR